MTQDEFRAWLDEHGEDYSEDERPHVAFRLGAQAMLDLLIEQGRIDDHYAEDARVATRALTEMD